MSKMKIKLGKIAINPKGDYYDTERYEKLDLVSHHGVGWVCRKPCIGITPSDGEYWQPNGTSGEGGSIVLENEVTENGANAVTSKGIWKAIDAVKKLIPTKIATTTQNGLMAKEDRVKLNGIDQKIDKKAESFDYKNNIFNLLDGNGNIIKSATIQSGGGDTPSLTIDTELDKTSNNAIANSAVVNALEYKVDSVDGMGLSHNDFTDTYKETIDGMQILTSDITYYVSTDGSDENDGSENTPFATVTKALSLFPKNLGGLTATIKIQQGNYREYGIKVNNFYNGILNIEGTNNVKFEGEGYTTQFMELNNNDCYLKLKSFTMCGIRIYNCRKVFASGFGVENGLAYIIESNVRFESFTGKVNYGPMIEVGYNSFVTVSSGIYGTINNGNIVGISRGILVCDSIKATGGSSQYTITGSGRIFIGNS